MTEQDISQVFHRIVVIDLTLPARKFFKSGYQFPVNFLASKLFCKTKHIIYYNWSINIRYKESKDPSTQRPAAYCLTVGNKYA